MKTLSLEEVQEMQAEITQLKEQVKDLMDSRDRALEAVDRGDEEECGGFFGGEE